MNKLNVFFLLVLFVGITISCGDDPILEPPEEEVILKDTTAYELFYGALPSPDLPEDNSLMSNFTRVA